MSIIQQYTTEQPAQWRQRSIYSPLKIN